MIYIFIVFQLSSCAGKVLIHSCLYSTCIDLIQFVICLSSMQEASGFICTRYHPTHSEQNTRDVTYW